MFKIPRKEKIPFHQRGWEYHCKALKLNYKDYPFYKDVLNLRVSTNMLQYGKEVEPYRMNNDQYLYDIKVCPTNALRPQASYSYVSVTDLCVPVNLWRHISKEFFPEALDSRQNNKRIHAKSPRIYAQSKGFIQSQWAKYITLIRQLAEEGFELIFVSVDGFRDAATRKVPDGEQLKQHLNKRDQSYYYPTAVHALGVAATKSGVLNDLTKRTKTMIEESLPSLEKLDEILAAILKLEDQDIEARAQAIVNKSMEAYEAKQDVRLKEAEDRQAQKLIEMHETINKLQDMVNQTFQQNELLLKAQEAQAGKYEDNLMNILGKLKDEL